MKKIIIITYFIIFILLIPFTAHSESSEKAAKTIHIWKVGSPHEGDIPSRKIPDDINRLAQEKGYHIEVSSYLAKGFSDIYFNAVSKKEEPEILVINNFGILDGIKTKLGNFTGIRENKQAANSLIFVSGALSSLEDEHGGWQFLVSSSKNYSKAKELVTRPPNCNSEMSNKFVVTPQTDIISKSAIETIEAYYNCNHQYLNELTDNNRIVSDCLLEDASSKKIDIKNIKVCNIQNNNNLAFVTLIFSLEMAVTYKGESQHSIGYGKSLVVLRKDEDKWKSLIIDGGGLSIREFTNSVPKLFKLLREENKIIKDIHPAVLLTENSVYPNAKNGERFGDFQWKPSMSDNIIAEIIEFNCGRGSLLFFSFDQKQSVGKISTGNLFRTHSSWRWRVLSIMSDGRVVFSKCHTFEH